MITLNGYPELVILRITSKVEDELSVISLNEVSDIPGNTSPHIYTFSCKGKKRKYAKYSTKQRINKLLSENRKIQVINTRTEFCVQFTIKSKTKKKIPIRFNLQCPRGTPIHETMKFEKDCMKRFINLVVKRLIFRFSNTLLKLTHLL